MPTTPDVRPFHRIAVLTSIKIVDHVTRDDLHHATPCAGWDLGELLAHMTVQHQGFAAAARGHGADLAVWDVATVADAVAANPAATYAAAARDVIAAFAEDGTPEAKFALPEFGPDIVVRGALAMGFHFIDYVVHGWDVARAIDVDFQLPADVIAAAEPIAFAVPDDASRRSPKAAFRAAIDPPRGGATLDRILAHLGRSPAWVPRPVRCA